MKKVFALAAVLAVMAWGSRGLWAAEGNSSSQKLTGEVVCLSCYLGHGAEGEKHAKCAKQCFKKGLPIGLKVGDKLYLAVGAHHGTADMLIPYTGRQVSVSGRVVQNGGMNMVEVESVQKAASPAKTYYCEMDGFTSDKPGKCPKCGMDLVEKK